jgi:hypothetical protein
MFAFLLWNDVDFLIQEVKRLTVLKGLFPPTHIPTPKPKTRPSTRTKLIKLITCDEYNRSGPNLGHKVHH